MTLQSEAKEVRNSPPSPPSPNTWFSTSLSLSLSQRIPPNLPRSRFPCSVSEQYTKGWSKVGEKLRIWVFACVSELPLSFLFLSFSVVCVSEFRPVLCFATCRRQAETQESSTHLQPIWCICYYEGVFAGRIARPTKYLREDHGLLLLLL
jgi:hypothetical protein